MASCQPSSGVDTGANTV